MSELESAHPRSRGENSAGSTSWMPDFGSSPLTRGKPRNAPIGEKSTRLIPAHAGKTRGSSPTPLTRGKRITRTKTISFQRLIPAHAGKTPWRPWGTGA